jgi:hypothetical protein
LFHSLYLFWTLEMANLFWFEQQWW